MEKELKERTDKTIENFHQIIQELNITSQNVIELMNKSVDDLKDKVNRSTIDPESVDITDLIQTLSPQQLLIEASHFIQQHLIIVYMQASTVSRALICIDLLSKHLDQKPKDIIDERWLWDTETDIRDEYISFVDNKLNERYDNQSEEVNS